MLRNKSQTAGPGQLHDQLSSHKRMKTINEDDDFYGNDNDTRGGQSMLTRNYSNQENDFGNVNRSNNILEESVADPSRAPIYVPGLTNFLTEQYFKKYGIYTNEAKHLQTFWKEYVSAAYKDLREQKQMMRTKIQTQHLMEQDYDFSGMGGFDEFDTPQQPKGKSMGLPPKGKATDKARTSKKFGFMAEYEKFSHLKELDVFDTINKDIQDMLSKKRETMIMQDQQARKRQADNKKKLQLDKINKILTAYFDYKKEEAAKAESKRVLQEKCKNKKPEEVKKIKEQFKKERGMSATVQPKRPASAAPARAASTTRGAPKDAKADLKPLNEEE